MIFQKNKKHEGDLSPFFGFLKKLVVVSAFLFSSGILHGKAVMPNIDFRLFVNGGKNDFNSIFSNSFSTQELKAIEDLFEKDQLDHEFSKAYDTEAVFQNYWNQNQKYWFVADLNKDGKKELLYLSAATENSEMEKVEIYSGKGNKYDLVFQNAGHLIAYKIHPNTQEIILFHHQYPCCSSASHNVNMIRLARGKMRFRKKYFFASDEGMKGEFFPKKVSFPSDFHFLNKSTVLRWCPEVIKKQAWVIRQENRLGTYPAKAIYKILARKGAWLYVEMFDKPSIDKLGVLAPDYFKDIHVFGWMKK